MDFPPKILVLPLKIPKHLEFSGLVSWKGSSTENPSTLRVPSAVHAVTGADETCSTSRLSALPSSCWHRDTEILEPTWHTGGCRAAEPSTVTLAQGIPKRRGQPHHQQHFQGYLHGWLHNSLPPATGSTAVPLSEAPELLHSAVQ